MPRVHLPDGRILNFPAGMSDAQMEAEITTLLAQPKTPAQPPREPVAYGGVGRLAESFAQTGEQMLQGIGHLGKQLVTNPKRVLPDIAEGIGNRVDEYAADMHPKEALARLKAGHPMQALGSLLPVDLMYRDPGGVTADLLPIAMAPGKTKQIRGGLQARELKKRLDPHMPNVSGYQSGPVRVPRDTPAGPSSAATTSPDDLVHQALQQELTGPATPSATFLGHSPSGPLYNIQGGLADRSTVGAARLGELGIPVPETPPNIGPRVSGADLRARALEKKSTPTPDEAVGAALERELGAQPSAHSSAEAPLTAQYRRQIYEQRLKELGDDPTLLGETWHSGAAPGSPEAKRASAQHRSDAEMEARYRHLMDDERGIGVTELLGGTYFLNKGGQLAWKHRAPILRGAKKAVKPAIPVGLAGRYATMAEEP